jgi:hypothetical protein
LVGDAEPHAALGDDERGFFGFVDQLQRERQLRELLERASVDQPVGVALAAAAGDWQRAGCQSPVPRPALLALTQRHLQRLRPEAAPTGAADQLGPVFDEGLAWAASTTGSGGPLLHLSGPGEPAGYRAHPLLGRVLDRQEVPWRGRRSWR